jgi:Holliday junction resolvase RusA-like endonuclease
MNDFIKAYLTYKRKWFYENRDYDNLQKDFEDHINGMTMYDFLEMFADGEVE